MPHFCITIILEICFLNIDFSGWMSIYVSEILSVLIGIVKTGL